MYTILYVMDFDARIWILYLATATNLGGKLVEINVGIHTAYSYVRIL